jgi:hypothetical protein
VLSRGLLTADVASTCSDALRLLAGEPALALPAIPEWSSPARPADLAGQLEPQDTVSECEGLESGAI